MPDRRRVVASWEAEYRSRRYLADPPLPFVQDILAAARANGLERGPGLYLGCGNGRNYLPLVAGGIALLGLDLSRTALAQLAARAPPPAPRLVCGDLSALAEGVRYPLVIAIQVLQHGNEATVHREVARVRERVAPNGLLCVRVNATGTELEHAHRVVERTQDGRSTVRYLAGPKAGLLIHFFSAAELRGLVEDGFTPVLPLRRVATTRPPPGKGEWVQWEGIWRRSPSGAGPSGGRPGGA